MKTRLAIIICAIAVLFSCKDEVDPEINTTPSKPNILLIIADDMGKDATSGFSEGRTKPTPPHRRH